MSLFPPPSKPKPTKHLVVRRNPVPQVGQMLEDAYEVLGHQLAQFRAHAAIDLFDVKTATAFSKMVGALVQLQDQERKQTAKIDISSLSTEEQASLEADAAAYLGLRPAPTTDE